jgi:hypothetical protein
VGQQLTTHSGAHKAEQIEEGKKRGIVTSKVYGQFTGPVIE